MDNNKIIEARDIAYRYPDGTLAIEEAYFDLWKGERVAIVGPNGSGKSTFLKIITGLIKPTKGKIKFYGKGNEKSLRKKFGVLLQNPDDVLFNATLMEDLQFAPSQLDMPKEKFEEILDEILKIFDLKAYLNRPPFKLSEGQKQQAAIASILTITPEVLFLDEPFTALDVETKERLIEYLNEINKKGVAIVTISHDLQVIPFVADRVYLLNKKMVADGKVREILSNVELLRKNGMDVLPIVKIGLKLNLNPLPLTIEELIEMLAK